ncbi:MAG: nitroreductase family protein [Lachnospiraceae bacterium]|nr:nitroreductase family protein [Lachnospiraceae bacterium]MDD3617241.1 nitroreductase family protein [Lachnospiraceae bacterium]
MEAKECIMTRRSIRKYTDQKVTQEDVETIVNLAIYAPTWKNVQANRYVAVLDEATKNRIADECIENFPGNNRNIHNAPALVALTTVDGRSGYERDGSFSTSKGTHWQSFDAGIAAQTFCLAAHSLGFGTVIMGIYEEDKVSEILQIPEGESVSALIALGYPAEEPREPKHKTVADILSFVD